MTQDEIIEMADKAGFFVKDKEAYSPSNQEDHELTPYLEFFAKLVATKERESCAKACETINSLEDYYGDRTELACAESIRARGQA